MLRQESVDKSIKVFTNNKRFEYNPGRTINVRGELMDSRESKDSGDSGSKPDTSHLNSHVVSGKKSSNKLVVWLVSLVVVAAAGFAGFYFYKTNVLDKDNNKEATVKTSPSKSPEPKKLQPEEQMTATLDNGIAKEMEELKKGDDTTVLKNSTQAAISVGIGEDNMKELERLKNEEAS